MPPIIILLSLILPSCSLTIFFFEGNVTCGLNRPFTYQIHVIEKDYGFHDAISKASFINAPTSPSRYNITAVDTNDGMENYYFDIAFDVYHNCFPGGQHMKAHLFVKDFWIYSGTHYYTYDIDLTRKGIKFDW